MTPELSRIFAVDRIGPAPVERTVEATPDECTAIAKRLGVPAVLSFACTFGLSRGSDTARGEVAAKGSLRAVLVRTCVVSLDDFEQVSSEQFYIRFVVAGTQRDDEDPEDPDELPYAGGAIDLGEVAVEQLALDLDPYPRKPDATLPPEAEDTEELPFAILARRK